LAALADGVTRLHGLLDSDDTAVMLDSLARLGVQIERESGVTQVTGCRGRFPNEQAALFVGNSGLTIRTLVPVICAALAQSFARPPTKADAPTEANGPGVQLHGVARMHERPIADLVDGLRALGAQIDYLGVSGYPPLRLRAAPLGAQTVTVRGDTSSQFLTGLLQAAPLVATTQALHIEVQGELISKPYVGITIALMARFGVRVERSGWSSFVVPPGQFYRAPGAIAVEGDASSASYFLAAGAIGGGPVRVLGVGQDSVQGDVAFAAQLIAASAGQGGGGALLGGNEAPVVSQAVETTAGPRAARSPGCQTTRPDAGRRRGRRSTARAPDWHPRERTANPRGKGAADGGGRR
jgi:3-phosphoshikimate 1-carboxyvinyltransferase